MTDDPREVAAALAAGEVLNPDCICPRCKCRPKGKREKHCARCNGDLHARVVTP